MKQELGWYTALGYSPSRIALIDPMPHLDSVFRSHLSVPTQ
jgi:hypothetical protein